MINLRRPSRIPVSLLLTCAAVALIALLPVVITLIQASQGGFSSARNALSAPSTPTLLKNTLLLAVVVTPVRGVVGVASAWVVERTRIPGRRIWMLLLVAPLAVPLFVTSYAWATLSTSLTGFWGAAGITAFSYYPIVFLLCAASLRVMDPALEETARSLGHSPWRMFWRVVMPQLRPALLGGVLLVLLDTLVEFDAFVALKFQTLSVSIYSQYQLSFPPLAGAVIAVDGRAAAVRWLDGLKRNGQIYQDDESVVAAVNRGDVPTGLINHYYWYRLRLELGANAVHSRLYYFPDHDAGSVENISGAAVLASSQHKALAERFVQFLVSPAGQRIIGNGDDFEYPARSGIAPNPALPPLAAISPPRLVSDGARYRPAGGRADPAGRTQLGRSGLAWLW